MTPETKDRLVKLVEMVRAAQKTATDFWKIETEAEEVGFHRGQSAAYGKLAELIDLIVAQMDETPAPAGHEVLAQFVIRDGKVVTEAPADPRATEPVCIGPHGDAFDCPKCDPRKRAAVPAPPVALAVEPPMLHLDELAALSTNSATFTRATSELRKMAFDRLVFLEGDNYRLKRELLSLRAENAKLSNMVMQVQTNNLDYLRETVTPLEDEISALRLRETEATRLLTMVLPLIQPDPFKPIGKRTEALVDIRAYLAKGTRS